jgi:hypothetical protein
VRRVGCGRCGNPDKLLLEDGGRDARIWMINNLLHEHGLHGGNLASWRQSRDRIVEHFHALSWS